MKKKGVSFDGGPVGYKRPPVEHQFKKGQKPPGSGRRPGSKNFATAIAEVLDSKLSISENGNKTRMSGTEALIRKAFASAMRGTVHDVARFIGIIDRLAPDKTTLEPQVMLIRTIWGDNEE